MHHTIELNQRDGVDVGTIDCIRTWMYGGEVIVRQKEEYNLMEAEQ